LDDKEILATELFKLTVQNPRRLSGWKI